MSKEKILILFHGEHIAYSPTVLQLYDKLSKKYDVTIVAEYPHTFKKITNRKLLYYKLYRVKSRHFYYALFKVESLINKEARYFKGHNINYKQYYFRYKLIKNIIKKNNYKAVISVDTMNALFCSIMKQQTDFISLELCVDEQYLPLINVKYIRSVIVQSQERYEYLFKNEKLPVFFVQNAPDYIELPLKQNRKSLIYAGTANTEFGFYQCLDFLNEYSGEQLTIQGAINKYDMGRIEADYKNLIDEQRLIISTKYFESEEMISFLSNYEIGFCFYNFESPVIKKSYFNYATAPSGKLFKYLAAGVPVVCNNIIGFKFVKDFQCGITITDLLPSTIKKAIATIRSNYEFYVNNSVAAAKHFSFDKAILPYLELIESS